jgi:hypothetical protein
MALAVGIRLVPIFFHTILYIGIPGLGFLVADISSLSSVIVSRLCMLYHNSYFLLSSIYLQVSLISGAQMALVNDAVC